MNSYVFEYNLLEADDRILYHRLQDKFDRVCVDDTISKVRNRIIELLDEDNYIEAKVYFKPKKYLKAVKWISDHFTPQT